MEPTCLYITIKNILPKKILHLTREEYLKPILKLIPKSERVYYTTIIIKI